MQRRETNEEGREMSEDDIREIVGACFGPSAAQKYFPVNQRWISKEVWAARQANGEDRYFMLAKSTEVQKGNRGILLFDAQRMKYLELRLDHKQMPKMPEGEKAKRYRFTLIGRALYQAVKDEMKAKSQGKKQLKSYLESTECHFKFDAAHDNLCAFDPSSDVGSKPNRRSLDALAVMLAFCGTPLDQLKSFNRYFCISHQAHVDRARATITESLTDEQLNLIERLADLFERQNNEIYDLDMETIELSERLKSLDAQREP